MKMVQESLSHWNYLLKTIKQEIHMEKKLNLDLIALKLEGLEETIILKLIDRAQFKTNAPCYRKGESGFEGAGDKSLLDIRLFYQEEMDAQFGRYRQPEERPFNQNLPAPKRVVNLPPSLLMIDDFNRINLTREIFDSYLEFIPRFCVPGDDSQYGSGTVTDVYALQAIAERIHYGALYVAESKFEDDPAGYRTLIRENNISGIMERLTRREVEERIIKRIREKVAYAQAKANIRVRNLIDPEIVQQYYRDHIIPLTKKGEIMYLMQRDTGKLDQ